MDKTKQELKNELIFAVVALERITKHADKMLHAITTMAIDGWLTGEYDLPDQKDLVQAAKDYLAYKKELRSLEEEDDE